MKKCQIAVLDDYQNMALECADWSVLRDRADITVFQDHLADPDAVIERLLPFDVVCVMRERTPLPRKVVERLPNLKLIASTGSVNASIDIAAAGALLVCKDQLFERADTLTIHLVLSSRTRGLVGATELERMKPTAWVINASRGPIVEEQALISALRNKQIAGAAIDVFDTEPLPLSHPFRTPNNVLATPHIGYVSQGTWEEAGRQQRICHDSRRGLSSV
jgi:phosphoglycerate dehydrogenase-like enzyme